MARVPGFLLTIVLCFTTAYAHADLPESRVLLGLEDPKSLEASASSGDKEAMTALAALYEHGQGVRKDLVKAVALYCSAARRGSAKAHYSIGWMLMNGRGMQRNDAEALYWLDKAAEGGHPQAAHLRQMFKGEPAARSGACRAQRDFVGSGPLRPLRPPKGVLRLVEEIAPRYGLDVPLVLALIKAESDFRPNAISPKRAHGLMQLLPETAALYGVTELLDPRQNILAGVQHLRDLLVVFDGDVTLALAAYNAGSGAVRRYGGVPPFKETETYIKRIRRYYREEMHPVTLGPDQLAAVMTRFRLPAQ